MINYKSISCDILNLLTSRERDIISILTQIETYQMAKDELNRSKNLFKNIDEQSAFLDKQLDEAMSSYLPLNQPLYSFMLNVAIPALILKSVYYRPSIHQVELHKELGEIFKNTLPNVSLCAMSRKEFFVKFVSISKFVNFTGKYENALDLQSRLSDSAVMIYNGSGINPIVVGVDADIEKASNDVIEARIYNSGQDCMAPTCIFVERTIAKNFLTTMAEKVVKLNVGENGNAQTQIGPLLEKDSLDEFDEMRIKYQNNIFVSGKINWKEKLIAPTIFYFDEVLKEPKKIYYAPYFFVMTFSGFDKIQRYLDMPYCELYAGYISLYGKSVQCRQWMSGKTPLIKLLDSTLFYEESGNMAFGGYGAGCSFVCHNGIISPRPILISSEIKKAGEQNGCI